MKLKFMQTTVLVFGFFLISCLSSCSWGKEAKEASPFNNAPQSTTPANPQLQECQWKFTPELTPVQVAQIAYRMQQECQLSEQEILDQAKLSE